MKSPITLFNASNENLRWDTAALRASQSLRELSVKAVAAMDSRKDENILEWAKRLVRDVCRATD